MSAINLYTVAPWASPEERRHNRLLSAMSPVPNGGATRRYAYVGGRRFAVTRDSWNSGWFVTEVFEDGADIWVAPDGTESHDARVRGVDYDLKFLRSCARLADVRAAIAENL